MQSNIGHARQGDAKNAVRSGAVLRRFRRPGGFPYQVKREVKSFSFPTWLAQPAALVPNPGVHDAPADGLDVNKRLEIARSSDLVIMHTCTPSFLTDPKFAELLKLNHRAELIAMVGPKTMS